MKPRTMFTLISVSFIPTENASNWVVATAPLKMTTMKACSVPIPPGEIGISVARLCVTWTSRMFRSDCCTPNASRKNQIAVNRIVQSPACQTATRRRYSGRSPSTATPWAARCLNSAQCSRSQATPTAPRIVRARSSASVSSGWLGTKPKSKPGSPPSEPRPGRTPSVSA